MNLAELRLLRAALVLLVAVGVAVALASDSVYAAVTGSAIAGASTSLLVATRIRA